MVVKIKMKAKYIVTNPLTGNKYPFRSRKIALILATEMARYFSLVTEITRNPEYKYGQGKIFVYANGTWRRF